MMMWKPETTEISRRIRMSTREIALAVGLTLLASVFVLAALMAPGQQAPSAPEPTASASDTSRNH